MLALSLDSRKAVDTMADTAGRHGGITDANPKQDFGFMYCRRFADPDGHIWEAFHMDMAAMPKA